MDASPAASDNSIAAAVRLPPWHAIELERELLARVSGGAIGFGWRLWRTTQSLIAPRALAAPERFAAAARRSAAHGWPVVMRDSGGDLVPQAPGVLNLSLVWRQPAGPGASLAAAYDRLCRPLRCALATHGLAADYGKVAGAFCDGRYNLVVAGRKIAGTAQRWKIIRASRDRPREIAVLAHAMLLVDTAPAVLADSVNAFYQHCGSARRCRAGAHTTVAEQHRRATGHHWKTNDWRRLIGSITRQLEQEAMPLTETIGG